MDVISPVRLAMSSAGLFIYARKKLFGSMVITIVKPKKGVGGWTMKTKQGHPCTVCGKELANHKDEIYDLVFQKRIVDRNKTLKMLSKMTLDHVYLCKDCAWKMHQFLRVYTGDESYFE